ncbi:platelet glycoprotein Ib beta chain-like isoform X2 [Acropora muricata]|uniref:platelet glycoprotein Ib beta chain-like isoform X2 n=1 Tax=Acropora muricata TaxID=159855 RepID=UPI0034E5A8A9
MNRCWLCAVTIFSMYNLSKSDVCSGLCYCSGDFVYCGWRGLNTTLLLNSSFPTNTTEMDLSGNAITQPPENVFSRLTSLKSLYLSYNAITQLPEKVFSGLTSLEYLKWNA